MSVTRFWKELALGGMLLTTAARSSAQDFNIDVDVEFGGYEAGAGVPSNSFGGAANQPGFWNLLGAANHTHSYPLFDLAGNATSATVRWNVSGGGAGSGWNGNTGDYRLLLNDCTYVTVPVNYRFENLLPGRYRITTYAVDRSGEVYPTEITVLGADTSTKVSGAGAMAGDQLVEGVTHSFHDLTLAGSTIELTARAMGHHGSVNGFQISSEPVPELGSASFLLVGLCWLFRSRRR